MERDRTTPRLALLALALGLGACNGPSGLMSLPKQGALPPDTSAQDPQNPTSQTAPSSNQVLLFNGSGVSTSDWQSTEQILKDQGMPYQLVNSSQMNALTLDEVSAFGLIVVPGGEGGSIAAGLNADARIRLRQAVRDRGVGYVGFCAGAWVAVGPEANTDQDASYGFAVAPGAVLDLFLPGGQEPTAAIVDVSLASGSHRNLVWWGGPITPEWKGGVVARYDTGKPAISETFSGKGLVVISGPHPEAPQSWRATAGNDPDGLDTDIAVQMFQAALNKKPMAAF